MALHGVPGLFLMHLPDLVVGPTTSGRYENESGNTRLWILLAVGLWPVLENTPLIRIWSLHDSRS